MYQWLIFGFKALLALLLLCILYGVLVWVGALIPINKNFKPLTSEMAGHDIYIRSNGVHTDIVLPITTKIRHWHDVITPTDLNNASGDLPYLSFGWGDKGFYLDTPTWAELKISTALIAIFGLGDTAMHIEAVAQPQVGEHVRHLRISTEQLAALVAHIDASFDYDAHNRVQKINTTANYGSHDAFYEARNSYSLLSTCNEWTRDGLSKAHIKTALFSPLAAGILRHLPR